jgi:replication factor A1
MTADELAAIKESNEAQFNAVINSATCKTYNFAGRAKQEVYNDIARTRLGITQMLPLDYKEEAWLLLRALQSEWGVSI